MKLLDKLKIIYGSEKRIIELYHGDLTDMDPSESVDLLVVSAIPDNYDLVPGTLVAALDEKGVSMQKLAENKAVDLRSLCSCWLSQEIQSDNPGINFKRILCFEPLTRGNPPEVVSDIFRSLAPLLGDNPENSLSITSVAMPLVACGNQKIPLSEMFPDLLDAAVHWMSLGLPLKNLKIVEFSEQKAEELGNLFSKLKGKYKGLSLKATIKRKYKYDIFISYSHENNDEVKFLINELERIDPNLRIFFDRMELNSGSAWQQRIYDALDESRIVVPIFSPPYIESKVCMEEYNIGHARHRESDEEVLFPIQLYTVKLPTYMRLIQFIDCAEADKAKMKKACKLIVSMLNK